MMCACMTPLRHDLPLLATCQLPDSTNPYAAIQHRLADASAVMADHCPTIGPFLGRYENDVAAHSRATLGHASSVYSTFWQITSKWPPPSTNCTWHGFPNCEESAALPFRS